ncbi:MAG: alpha/beta hydrolase [Sphingomicrobium sp.]
MNVVESGSAEATPLIMLHGFPESHRTWRGVAPLLGDRFRLIMPDLRGFGASDRPLDVAAYRPETVIGDIFALADALGIEEFALAGHDWGGAIAWPAALANPKRIKRLAVVNSPHPWIFQKSIIDDPAQRAASQYISAFRNPPVQQAIEAQGFDWFFERSFSAHVDLALIDAAERARYIADWSRPGALEAMLNWYRATGLRIPAMGEVAEHPQWMEGFPKLSVPTLVIWGMRDKALLPIQLDGLSDWVDDLTIVKVEDAGHFVPWEKPAAVAKALLAFLGADP